MKLFRSLLMLLLVFSFYLLVSFTKTLPMQAVAGAYSICVTPTFTLGGVAKTTPYSYKILDGESDAVIISLTDSAKCFEPKDSYNTIRIDITVPSTSFHDLSSVIEIKGTSYTYAPLFKLESVTGPGTTTTPSPSAGASGSPTPTPPTEGAGWCGDDASVRAGFLPVPAGTTPPCAMKDAVYVPRATPKDPYCDKLSSGAKPYFYKCSGSVSGTPTPTPTPYKKALEGEACIPSQGPWQCMQNNYCAQTCTSFGASCTTGKCCPDNKVWLGTTCGVPASTPTPSPSGAKPTPITTSGKCDDVILTAAGSVSQACVRAASCISPDIENAGGSETCSQFYGGSKTGYVCCQKLVVNSGAVGSSCSVTNRLCDTNLNSSTGTNTQCTGCGGYCIKPAGGTEAFCQSI